MSLSNEWTEYHLTPKWWIEGSTKVDFGGTTVVDPPSDRVKTCRVYERQSSSFSKVQRGINLIWESDDKAAVETLLEEHGPCPDRV